MGDITSEAPRGELQFLEQGSDREVKVLVTGYGPFHTKFPVNSSWSIASTLPEYLPATATCPRIKLIVPPEPIEVSYRAVQSFAEKWLAECDYDLILHIGLAAGRQFFTLEQQSMRDPYWEKKDVNGVVFSKQETETCWPKDQYPHILKPTFDCDDIWRRWRSNVSIDLDIRPSDDPGNYLCGYIYYYSMAWFWGKKRDDRPVVFLHVPDLPTEEKVTGGREVAVGLIRAMVESREKKGICDPLNGDVVDQRMGAAEITVGESAAGEADADMAWTYQR